MNIIKYFTPCLTNNILINITAATKYKNDKDSVSNPTLFDIVLINIILNIVAGIIKKYKNVFRGLSIYILFI